MVFLLAAVGSYAQVNAVTYGKNRVQFKKFKWQYYQTENFNVYFNQNGQEIAKYVMQAAEKELPEIEEAAEYSLQRRANIIVYNSFADRKQTNIGLGSDIISTGSTTKLVNNKIVVYFDGNHANLKRQIREGIADVITKNVLFGDDLGEVAGNQTLLDLPVWLTDGYVAYLGENWSTALDDELKSEILSGNYNKFSKLSFEKPLLAGHAFWFFIEEKYKKENVTYFLYLARIYKNLNKASLQITKKKFKELLAEFMEYQEEKYYKDIARRKAYPKGNYIEGFDISKRLNYYRFNVNPNKKNNSFVVTQFKKGIVRVLLNDDYEYKTLLKYGIRTYENQMNPNYPMMAWDPKGTRIAVIYAEEGKLKLFVYDLITRIKQYKLDLTDKFDQVQDITYKLDSRTLLLSAVKNGHTDIYTLNLENEKVQQITNDVYDNLDASFVSFPNKTGIIYASNRPSASAKTGDSVLPSNNRFNIFLITDFGDKPELNQITQLTDVKYGDARFPTQYNNNHFTFISDQNGIANRYAGFFTTKKEGLDTLVLIGDDILRNPSPKEVDSTLRVYKKTDVDSIAVVSVSSDSAYSFPLSNYPSALAESRIAGDSKQVSEVTRQSDEKILYKLKIDEFALSRRNISAQPTEYAKKLMRESRFTKTKQATNIPGQVNNNVNADTTKRQDDFFQTEFDSPTSTDSSKKSKEAIPVIPAEPESVLKSAKLFRYKPLKFSADYGSVGFSSSVLVNKYQPYGGGSGPIMLNSATPLNGLITLGTSDLLEDIKITGAFKIGTNLKDNEWLASYQNYKRRLDWGVTYYRNVQGVTIPIGDPANPYPLAGKIFTNLYQGNIAYPFDEVRSIRFSTGIRSDNVVVSSDPIVDGSSEFESKPVLYSVNRLEYVHDNTLNPSQNIWNGLRFKVFADWNRQVSKIEFSDGPNTFNVGFDARYYYPIYRNFIWAGRVAGDFSWGNQKFIYYLGGVDGWLMFGSNTKKNGSDRYFNTNNPPAGDQDYAFQSLAVNMRGYIQNVASGNNALVINSEFRLPVFSTFFDRTVNNAFLRNFQIVQFTDLGTAWNGGYDGIKRPTSIFTNQQGNVLIKVKAGGVGPFAGGYGFGARSTIFGYFVKFDAGWPMSGFFKGKPVTYLSLGLDF
ncbi:MAG TPA: hypothetical protein PLC48_06860 [Ferruginibacter sp.]|nr:hypothetical protein [Ferruginibacter sp.]